MSFEPIWIFARENRETFLPKSEAPDRSEARSRAGVHPPGRLHGSDIGIAGCQIAELRKPIRALLRELHIGILTDAFHGNAGSGIAGQTSAITQSRNACRCTSHGYDFISRAFLTANPSGIARSRKGGFNAAPRPTGRTRQRGRIVQLARRGIACSLSSSTKGRL